MSSVKPQAHAPLTADMEAALQLLARSTDQALVRLHSQWWVLESDRYAVSQLPLESVEAGSPVYDKPLVRTQTVAGLVRRGRLRLTGPVRKGPGYRGRARAEVVPQ